MVSEKHTSDEADLSNAVGITQDDTDLRGSSTTLGEAADLLDDLVGSGLQPRRGSAAVGSSRGANTLSLAVKTTHGCGVAVVNEGCRWSWLLVELSIVEVVKFAKSL
jgi:hypothetical protein